MARKPRGSFRTTIYPKLTEEQKDWLCDVDLGVVPENTTFEAWTALQAEKAKAAEAREQETDHPTFRPLVGIDMLRLATVLHNYRSMPDIWRRGDGSNIMVSTESFPFMAFVDTLRTLIPKPLTGRKRRPRKG